MGTVEAFLSRKEVAAFPKALRIAEGSISSDTLLTPGCAPGVSIGSKSTLIVLAKEPSTGIPSKLIFPEIGDAFSSPIRVGASTGPIATLVTVVKLLKKVSGEIPSTFFSGKEGSIGFFTSGSLTSGLTSGEVSKRLGTPS